MIMRTVRITQDGSEFAEMKINRETLINTAIVLCFLAYYVGGHLTGCYWWHRNPPESQFGIMKRMEEHSRNENAIGVGFIWPFYWANELVFKITKPTPRPPE